MSLLDFLRRDILKYQEGEWTPFITDLSLSKEKGQRYTFQKGTFTRVGNRVMFDARLAIESIGSLQPTQGAIVGGLPFQSGTGFALSSSLTVGIATGLLRDKEGPLSAFIGDAADFVSLITWDRKEGTGPCPLSALRSNADIYVSGVYRAV